MNIKLNFKPWEYFTFLVATYFVIDSYLSFLTIGLGLLLGYDAGQYTFLIVLIPLTSVIFWLIIVRFLLNNSKRRVTNEARTNKRRRK